MHYKLYKPFGMLSQLYSNDPKEAKSKQFLNELFHFPKGQMPIGRLDEKSEGLLLMTNDGKLSDFINRSGVEKEYYAQVDGLITDAALDQLAMGIEIGLQGKKYKTKPCIAGRTTIPPSFPDADAKLRIGRHRPNSWISICITEGKYRQIRKMTAAVGFPTVRLVRVRIGVITLENLKPREVKMLNEIPLPSR